MLQTALSTAWLKAEIAENHSHHNNGAEYRRNIVNIKRIPPKSDESRILTDQNESNAEIGNPNDVGIEAFSEMTSTQHGED